MVEHLGKGLWDCACIGVAIHQVNFSLGDDLQSYTLKYCKPNNDDDDDADDDDVPNNDSVADWLRKPAVT